MHVHNNNYKINICAIFRWWSTFKKRSFLYHIKKCMTKQKVMLIGYTWTDDPEFKKCCLLNVCVSAQLVKIKNTFKFLLIFNTLRSWLCAMGGYVLNEWHIEPEICHNINLTPGSYHISIESNFTLTWFQWIYFYLCFLEKCPINFSKKGCY